MKLGMLTESLNLRLLIGLIPSRYHNSFMKAVKHRKISSKPTGDLEALRLVADGLKPVAIVHGNDHITMMIDKYGLSSSPGNGSSIYVYNDNDSDLVELMSWAYSHLDMRSPDLHRIIGICLGYGFNEVEDFSRRYESDEVRFKDTELNPFEAS